MDTTENQNPAPPEKKAKKVKKAKGPIRWNAIIPFLIVALLTYLYFLLFFDTHMRKALEWAGYKALGAEVNIGSFKSSFTEGSVQITKVELTSTEKPDFNAIELGDIRFNLNWGALLRVKFVVEEIAVEGVQFMSKRAYPGRVAPPPPPSGEPGFAQQLEDKALNKLDKDNQNNILGDAAQFLKSGNFDAQLKNLEGQLASKKLIEQLNAKWAAKQTEWNSKLKTLPTNQDMKALNDRFNKIKFKDFANVQELDASVKEADAIIKEIDARTKQVQDLKTQLDTDLKSVDQDYKSIDQQVKADIENVKSHLKIPKIDAASFAKALFMDYLKPITRKVDTYRALAEKYLPPKYARMVAGQKDKKEPDDSIQPHPREEGVTYEFPVKNGYPLFWIQKISLSSKSNAQADYGDFTGLITHITSNQRQIGQPTTARVRGDFNKMNLKGISLDAVLDNRGDEAAVQFGLGVGSYPLSDLKLMQSKDGAISIPATNASLESSGKITGFRDYDFKLNNTFSNVNFAIATENATMKEILTKTLGTINKFDLQATAKGELKNLDIELRSSLAGDLEKAFQNLLQAKVKEANEQLQKAVNGEIEKVKAQFNAQVDGLKSQAQGEVNKVQTQINDQKKQAEDKVAAAKKDFEDQAKNKIQQEGKKQVDDLKKKFGL